MERQIDLSLPAWEAVVVMPLHAYRVWGRAVSSQEFIAYIEKLYPHASIEQVKQRL